MTTTLSFIRTFLALISGFGIAAFFAGCFESDEVGPDKIYIGELAPVTGSQTTFGVTVHRGVQMAIDEFNATDTINGRKLELILKDTGSDKDRAATTTTELIEIEKVFAIIGEVSSDRTKAAAHISHSSKTPLVTPASTNPFITAVGDYIFRVCYIDPFQGSAMAKFAFGNLKLRRFAVLKDRDSNYSLGLAEYFVEGVSQLSGEIVYDGAYTVSNTDYNEQLTEIKLVKPDAIFIPGYAAQVAEIVKQATTMGIKATFLGGDGWDSPDLINRGGKAMLGAYFTNHFSPESTNPRAVAFVKKYKQVYGTVPDGTAATGYDAANMLISAMKSLKKLTRQRLRDALAKTKNFEGVTGSITLDKNRDAIKPIVVLKVQADKNAYVTTISP